MPGDPVTFINAIKVLDAHNYLARFGKVGKSSHDTVCVNFCAICGDRHVWESDSQPVVSEGW